MFSLERAMSPTAGGFYPQVFDRVKSVEATGQKTFTIHLKQADQWLLGELSATPGEVVQKAYAQAKGKAFGTVSGGIMCSGPFKLESWKTGQGVKMVPNPDYWDTTLPTPKVTSLTVIGVPDDAALTAGLTSGSIDGDYGVGLSTLGQLENNKAVNVYQGAPYATVSMVISATKGPLSTPDGRKALSEAIDRQGIINTVYQGAGSIPHAAAASGTWGYAESDFQKAYDALPPLDQDVAQAKADAKAAGIVGDTITIGTSSGIPSLNTETLAIQAGSGVDRAQGEAEEREPVELHQLLHRPEVLRLRGHVHHRELRGLRRPGRALQQLHDAGRLAELQRLQQPPGRQEP